MQTMLIVSFYRFSTFEPANKHGKKVLAILQGIEDMQLLINQTQAIQNLTNSTSSRIYDRVCGNNLQYVVARFQ